MRNMKKLCMVTMVFALMLISSIQATSGESIGASIQNQAYKLSSKAPIVPTYSNAKVSTSCGSTSVSSNVQSVIWYNKTAAITTGSCTSKLIVQQVGRGNTRTRTLTLPSDMRHFTIGAYAGLHSGMKSSTEKKGTGSALATNCN